MADIVTNIPELFGDLTIVPGKVWEVAYTKPKREKKLAEYAMKSDICYYLPMTDSIKHYERKKIVYKKPLFSSYVFVRIDHNDKQQLVVTGHLVTFINVRDQQQLLDELSSINQVRDTGMEITVHPYLTEGIRVRFKEGPLQGVIGLVKDVKNIENVILQVNILKRAIAVTADSSILEVLDDYEEDDED